MLVHHDSRPYEVAAGEAKNKALSKINELINKGRANAAKVIEQVQTQIPEDAIVRVKALEFSEKDGRLLTAFGGKQRGFHRNALGQAAAKASIPMAYIDTLTEAKQVELLAENFNKRFSKIDNRALLRSVNGEVRGFLSDRYRRIDARPIMDSFVSSLNRLGALPYDGYALETKVAMQAILPEVFEPVPNEVIAFVLNLSTSDFGAGAVEMNLSALRIWCTNLAMGEEMLHQIHLGKRLSDNVTYSDETYQLDAKTVVSALNDTIDHAFKKETMVKYLGAIRTAHEEKIDPWKVKEVLKKALGKDVSEQVIEAFNSPDVEMLPAGNNAWRMSNAISWVAGKEEHSEKKLDMMKVAGEWAKLVA